MAKHPKGCEQAEHDQCRCQACGGSLHQWTWCLEAATEASGLMRSQRRDKLNSAWAKAEEKGLPMLRAEAAVNHGVVDVVDWLAADYRHSVGDGHENISVVASLRAGLAGLVAESVQHEVDRVVGKPGPFDRPNPARLAMADHFWCDLFSAIASLAEHAKVELDKIPHEVAALITDSRGTKNNLVKPKRGGRPRSVRRIDLDEDLTQRLVEAVLTTAWRPVRALYGGKLDLLAKHARILAVLICPAPERHRVVMKECMEPMFDREICKPSIDKIKASLYKDLFA